MTARSTPHSSASRGRRRPRRARPAVSQSGRTATAVNLSWTASSDNRARRGLLHRRNGTDIAFTNGTTWSDEQPRGRPRRTPTKCARWTRRATSRPPGSVNVGVFAVSDPTLIAAKSVWKYLDNGTDQGTAWRNVGFDDSTWASGAGILGYGRGDEGTVVSYGPNAEPALPDDLLPAHVQRRQRGGGDRSPAEDAAEGRRAVYINGVEVARPNMAGGHDHVADVRRGERRRRRPTGRGTPTRSRRAC